MSRKINKEIRIDSNGSKVFNALITPGLLKEWWGASQAIVVPDENGVFALSWGENIDKPDYTIDAQISEFKPHIKLTLSDYHYLVENEYLPFKAKFKVKFRIECETNYCILRLEHSGFPGESNADSFYAECEKGWNESLKSLKNLMENNEVPVYK
ncbi:SRPBCC domain-containing protein [Salegentibacter sp. JZCK2]|uniref:SRPBCC family protein n=1 Tax=Salegentibacter tibetensis TaxID=2873600 RepID=UPI001CCAB82B|nr:SRPBCC domain-containing protein [Salegentibacter tibetensis]MBZ9729247.1 SRPBCC domain-containing protein [Salegentibacter tibetensis]